MFCSICPLNFASPTCKEFHLCILYCDHSVCKYIKLLFVILIHTRTYMNNSTTIMYYYAYQKGEHLCTQKNVNSLSIRSAYAVMYPQCIGCLSARTEKFPHNQWLNSVIAHLEVCLARLSHPDRTHSGQLGALSLVPPCGGHLVHSETPAAVCV